MVNVKCCVPGCVSSNRRFHYLKFHTLPKDSCRRKTWKLAIKKPRQVSKWSSICRLHFKGGWKQDFYANPSIFPWSQEWPDVVKSYNKYVVEKFIQSQAVDHTNAKLPNLMEVPICTATTASANPSGPPTITSIQVNRGLVFIFVI